MQTYFKVLNKGQINKVVGLFISLIIINEVIGYNYSKYPSLLTLLLLVSLVSIALNLVLLKKPELLKNISPLNSNEIIRLKLETKIEIILVVISCSLIYTAIS
jgi:hypothetical protein